MAQPRYAAFISYRHLPRDRAWAIKIMRLLETYRTPKELSKQGYPARIGTLFRDEDEVPASTDLSDQIKDALAHSDNLIVICTPETLASRWVDREIELFQQMGKGARIIPLLVAGEPGESFPPRLLRRRVVHQDGTEQWQAIEPIAADVRPREDESSKKIERRALLRLAAALLNCRFDDLAQRDAARRRAQRRRIGGTIAATVALLATLGTWWWDANWRVKSTYFAMIGQRWGEPFGLQALNDDTRRHRNFSWRIQRRAGKVVELARLNGSGNLAEENDSTAGDEPWDDGVARWQYDRDANGFTVNMYSRTGIVVRSAKYEFAPERAQAIVRFSKSFGVAERQGATGWALSGRTGENAGKTSIGQHRLLFDAVGFAIRRMFEPVGGGNTVGDALGAHGRSYDYDRDGRLLEIRNLDAQGETLIEPSGVATIRISYGDSGAVSHQQWLDIHGKPVANANLVASWKVSNDRHGNIVKNEYFGADGLPALRKDSGVAGWTMRYDERGNATQYAYFGIDGKPVPTKEDGVASGTARHDESGNAIEHSWFGVDGKPTLTRNFGIARQTIHYDGRGNAVEHSNFGIDGKPILRKDSGVARQTALYDDRGKLVESRYFGVDGKPILTKNTGVAIETMRYDEQGHAVEYNYLGLDGRPVLRKDQGISRTSIRYDERGNAVENAYFDAAGQPTLRGGSGIAKWTTRYDERGNAIEYRYFGVDGRPILRKDNGVARATMNYDGRGNTIRIDFFGTDDKPILSKDTGVAGSTARHDERGNVVRVDYFGIDGKPILTKDVGVAGSTARHDERGNLVELGYFGSDGKPILSKDKGIAAHAARYDGRGKVVRVDYFGLDDQPILVKDIGAATQTNRYDERGNLVAISYFGVDGLPISSRDLGVASIVSRYDERSNAVEISYFGTDAQPVVKKGLGAARSTQLFDGLGNVVENRFYGADGELTLASDWNVAIARHQYDAAGNETELAFFDTKGLPILSKDWEVAGERTIFDDYGRDSETIFFGLDGRPLVSKKVGFSMQKYRYDASGVVEVRHFDAAGVPIKNYLGFATAKVARDSLGRVLQIEYFDPADRPCRRVNQLDGQYDDDIADLLGQWRGLVLSGNFTRQEIASIDQGGFARFVQAFDSRGNATTRAYFDERGAPTVGFNGAVAETIRYDTLDRPMLLTLDKPGAGAEASTSMRIKYDARGLVSRIDYVSKAGAVINGEQGIATFLPGYDDQGTMTSVIRTDGAGNVLK